MELEGHGGSHGAELGADCRHLLWHRPEFLAALETLRLNPTALGLVPVPAFVRAGARRVVGVAVAHGLKRAVKAGVKSVGGVDGQKTGVEGPPELIVGRLHAKSPGIK